MKTKDAIKKITPILYRLFGDAEPDSDNEYPVAKLKYYIKHCDQFTLSTVLTIEISVEMSSIDNMMHEPNHQVRTRFEDCSVDKISIINERGEEVLTKGQMVNLVKFINNFTYNYFKNL